MDIPPHALPAMMGTPLRQKWDDMAETVEYAEANEDQTNAVMRIVLMPPMVARREAFLHRIIARDFPEPGCFTVVGMDGSSGREVAGGMVRAYLRMLNVI